MQETYFTHMSLVPVRGAASDAAEMVTQLHFGEVVELLGRDRQWMHVRLRSDGYTGWIDEKAVLQVNADWLAQVTAWEWVLDDACRAETLRAGALLPLRLGLGARIPRFGDAQAQIGDWQLIAAPGSLAAVVHGGPESVVALSERFLGVPYLWGGKSLAGIDCSGLTQVVYALAGVPLPRDARDQALAGSEVSWDSRQAGDLAFFHNAAGRVNHVGIVLPDGNVRHASGQVHDATLDSQGIVGKFTGVQTHTLCSIKRIF